MGVNDDKKVIDALLDDDESFMVRKREKDKIEDVVKSIRESIKRRSVDERENVAESKVEIKPTKYHEQPYLSDIEINVLKAVMRFGGNVKRISKATGYPGIVISKAIEKLVEKGYLDENLNVAEKAIPIASVPEEEYSIGIKIIDIAIILTAIVFIVSTLIYLGLV